MNTPSLDKIHSVCKQFVVTIDDKEYIPDLHQIELAMQIARCLKPRLFPGDGIKVIMAIVEQHFCE